MSLATETFKRFRSGNCWVTAAVLSEDCPDVELVGAGFHTAPAGSVLIVCEPIERKRYDNHSSAIFFDLLGFKEVDVNEVVNDPNTGSEETDSEESVDE